MDKQEYYDNKYPKADISYRRVETDGKYLIDVRQFVNPHNHRLPEIFGIGDEPEWEDDIAFNGLIWVIDNVTYTPDKIAYRYDEYWAMPWQTHERKRGDCIAEYEEIYTKEGIKKAKDVRVGDLVLSYDFKSKSFCYKPIVNKWDKGILNIKRVYFRNGQHIDVTENHHMAVREIFKESNYIKRDLKDVDLTRWWKRKVPIAVKIPYEVKDIEWLTEDLCFVIGHFLAEGYINSSNSYTCGWDINEVLDILDKKEIPFTETTNGQGLPVIRFLKSKFNDYLKSLKKNSFDIHLPEEIFHLPEGKLNKILEGFWLGDGHNGNYLDKRGFNSNKAECYSTSSEQWARDIQRIGLQIGKSFHIWKQKNHRGFGKKPIYRITFNPNSHFLKNHGYQDISEVSISYIEDLGKCQTFDWEVEETHTFVFKNGIITFQCEDGACLLYSILSKNGVRPWKMRVSAGNVVMPNGKKAGHAYLNYYHEASDSWKVLDWCFAQTRDKLEKRVDYREDKRYDEVWFSFNELNSWSKGLNSDAQEFLGGKNA